LSVGRRPTTEDKTGRATARNRSRPDGAGGADCDNGGVGGGGGGPDEATAAAIFPASGTVRPGCPRFEPPARAG